MPILHKYLEGRLPKGLLDEFPQSLSEQLEATN